MLVGMLLLIPGSDGQPQGPVVCNMRVSCELITKQNIRAGTARIPIASWLACSRMGALGNLYCHKVNCVLQAHLHVRNRRARQGGADKKLLLVQVPEVCFRGGAVLLKLALPVIALVGSGLEGGVHQLGAALR